MTSGLPLRAGFDGKIRLSCVTSMSNTETNGWLLSARAPSRGLMSSFEIQTMLGLMGGLAGACAAGLA